MLSIKRLFGYHIRGTDGDIGTVNDFSFDDESWTIRYLVLDIGAWAHSRQVLLPVEALQNPNPGWDSGIVHVRGTIAQVRRSLSPDDDPTVSHQKKMALAWHPEAWERFDLAFVNKLGLFVAPREDADTEKKADAAQKRGTIHLRSAREVIQYHVQAKDGEIGHIDDYIVDESDWRIRHLAVNTNNWLPGRNVLVSPQSVERVEWAGRKVFVNMLREDVRKSPEYRLVL